MMNNKQIHGVKPHKLLQDSCDKVCIICFVFLMINETPGTIRAIKGMNFFYSLHEKVTSFQLKLGAEWKGIWHSL